MPPPTISIRFGLHRQLERAGRGDDARIVLRHERQLHRLRAGGDDRAREADRRRAALGEVDDDVVGVAEAAAAGDHRHLAHLRHLREAAGKPADDLVLVRDELGRIDLRRAEVDADGAEVRDLVDHRGDVQHRLRRDAADVEADAAERLVALDQHDLEAEVGGAKRGRVAARAGAEDEQVADRVAADARGGRGAGRRRCAPGPARRGRRARALSGRGAAAGAGAAPPRAGLGLEAQDQRALVDLVADRDLELLTTPACDDGISIDALSLSIVIRLCSTAMVSPGLTSTSMTATSLKSPMSGTRTSIVTAAPCGSRRAPGSGRR